MLKYLKENNNLKYRIGFSATPLTNNERQNIGILKLYGKDDILVKGAFDLVPGKNSFLSFLNNPPNIKFLMRNKE